VTLIGSVAVTFLGVGLLFRQYQPWLWYVAGFVAIRVVFAGAGLYSAALYAVGAQRALYLPAIAGGVVAIAANAVLTRPFGLGGAIIAYCLTQGIVAILTVIAFRYFPGIGTRESGLGTTGERGPGTANREQQLRATG
jgi:O-antigen/teichoic acid export membrane protein